MNEQERIQDIKTRYLNAAGGEWKYWHKDTVFKAGEVDFGNFDALVYGEEQRSVCSTLDRKNAEFIANAHQDIPWLIEQIERLERENAAFRAQGQDEPLTCDGCEYVAVEMAVTRCLKCNRFALLRDRYKPKGAH